MADATPPARKGVGLWTVVLLVLFILLAAEGAVLIALHFSARVSAEPFTQQGTVNADTAVSFTVFYPVPFASPPNLTLTVKTGEFEYVVVQQDEFGFTWRSVPKAKPPADPQIAGEVRPEFVPAAGPPVFAWEAKGVTGKSADAPPRPFEQSGSFPAPSGQDGEVYFVAPYATPPNVTLAANRGTAMVVAVTPLGFTWRNTDKAPTPPQTVTWTAVGTRAAPGQTPPAVKADTPLKATEQTGQFHATAKQKGEVNFPLPYALPPNVTVEDQRGADKVVATQVTATGFKWECVDGTYSGGAKFIWKAKGVLATVVPGEK